MKKHYKSILLASSLVPSDRFELSTSPLPMVCSTPELRGRGKIGGKVTQGCSGRKSLCGAFVKLLLKIIPLWQKTYAYRGLADILSGLAATGQLFILRLFMAHAAALQTGIDGNLARDRRYQFR